MLRLALTLELKLKLKNEVEADVAAEVETGAEELGGTETPEPAAEGYKVEKDLPLILENKGIDLPNLEEMTKKANSQINQINKQIDDLVEK